MVTGEQHFMYLIKSFERKVILTYFFPKYEINYGHRPKSLERVVLLKILMV